MVVRKILPHKVHILYLKRAPVQWGEISGIGSEGEGQPVGVERLIAPVKALVQFSVLSVPQKRMPGVGKLGADLVSAAGDQVAFHQRQSVLHGKDPVVRPAGLAAGLGGVRHKDPVLFCVFEKESGQASFLFGKSSFCNGEVSFVNLPILDFLI